MPILILLLKLYFQEKGKERSRGSAIVRSAMVAIVDIDIVGKFYVAVFRINFKAFLKKSHS